MAIYIAGGIIETFSYGSLPALYVGRLVADDDIGALTVVGPMAIVEIAPAMTRRLMTLWFNICMLSSQMVRMFVTFGCNSHIPASTNLQYQIPFFVQCFVPTIGIVMSFFLHESPRWLSLRGRIEDVLKTLTTLGGVRSDDPLLTNEWEMTTTQLAREQSEFGNTGYGSVIRKTFCVPIEPSTRPTHCRCIHSGTILGDKLSHRLPTRDIWNQRSQVR